MKYTSNYRLIKPEGPEYYNVEQFNSNADTIDRVIDEHVSARNNPHVVTKAQIGLGNVDNTSDLSKPISTAVQTALNDKMNKGDGVTGVKGNSETEYRSGNVNITKSNIGLDKVQNVTTNGQTPTFNVASALVALKSGETLTLMLGKIARGINDLISHLANESNPHAVTKEQVGLDEVGNFLAVSTEASQGLTNAQKTNARANIGLGSVGNFKAVSTVASQGLTSAEQTNAKTNIGLGKVGNYKAVSTVAGQGLTDAEKANARANIGAGSSTPSIIFVRKG